MAIFRLMAGVKPFHEFFIDSCKTTASLLPPPYLP